MAGLTLGFILRIPNLCICSGKYSLMYFKPTRILLESSIKIRKTCIRSFCQSHSEISDKFKKKLENKKNQDSPKILVEDLRGKLISMYLEEAQKLAKRNGLQLILLSSIGKKVTYKLAGVNALNENTVRKKKISKIFLIDSECSKHDFQNKLSAIIKLLKKGKSVVVDIQDKKNNPQALVEFSAELENLLGNEYRVTKNKSKLRIKFEIFPPKNEKAEGKIKKEEPKGKS